MVTGLLIGDIVARATRMAPKAIAASFLGTSLTFGELDDAANRTANALAGLGVGHGDRVLWWTAPGLATLAGFLGSARLGAVYAPLNPGLSPSEFEAIAGYLDPRVVVTDQPVELGVPVLSPQRLETLAAQASAAHPGARVADTDPHIVYLTSGSTGRPKGVLVSHRASWLRAAPGGGTFTTGIRGRGGVVCSFPLYHYGGWHYVMEAWQNATAVHLVPRAEAASIVDAVRRFQAGALYCIPAVWERLLDDEHRHADLSSLRHADIGTSGFSPGLLDRLKQRLPHTTTTVLYGSTEAGRMAALQDWDLRRKPGSVGLPAFPGALWVAPDGEVCASGPGLMSGYHNLPQESVAALVDGVYRSGDLGYVDDEGYLYLTGRRQAVIRSGGESVSPSEVESVLRDFPGVSDVAVVGLPDDTWGETVCAVLVLHPGATAPTVEQLRAHVAGRLAAFKQPRRIAVVTRLPRTSATGQIQHSRIRESLLKS